MIVHDISGHPSREGHAAFLADLAEAVGGPVTYRHAGPWDVGVPQSGDELRAAVVRLLDGVWGEPDVEASAFVIPGYSPSVAAFLALYHGRHGHFPRLIWIIKDADGTWAKPVLLDLDATRSWARANLRFSGGHT